MFQIPPVLVPFPGCHKQPEGEVKDAQAGLCCAVFPHSFPFLQPDACKYFAAISPPPPPKRGKPPYIVLKPRNKNTIKVLPA